MGALTVALVGLAYHQHGATISLTPNVPAAVPSLVGRMLYTRDGGLWVLTPADGQAVQVAPAPELGQVTAARWSPDGQQIVFAVHEIRDRRIPVSTVFIADADGKNPRRLVGSEDASTFYQLPVWATDGKFVYVVHTGQGIRRVERIDATTGDALPIIDELGQFDLSRDGRWLVIARSTNTGNDLLLVDLISGEQRKMVGDRDFDLVSSPRFDPRSQSLIFAGAGGRTAQIPTSEGLANLFDTAVAHAHGIPLDLFSMSIAGGAPKRVASLQLDDPATSWSTDGSYAALFSYEALQALKLSDGSLTPILVPGGYGSVDWAR